MNQPSGCFLGVVADGSTDRAILSHLFQTILPGRFCSEPFMLSQNLRGIVDNFKSAIAKTDTPFFCSNASSDFRKSVIALIFSALTEFKANSGRDLNHNDILIINTDSESFLNSSDTFFNEEWSIILSRILFLAVEEFYHKIVSFHYQFSSIPLIVPIMLFPSTDILVAAAKSFNQRDILLHGHKASELKRHLYGVTDLRLLREDDLNRLALSYITSDSCESIFLKIPEFRLLFKLLHWGR